MRGGERQRAVDAAEAELLAQDRQAVEQARADGRAGDRDADRVDDVGESDSARLDVRLGGRFERGDVERLCAASQPR